MKAYDTGLQTNVAILDFSKAFDTVPHKKLLSKMDSYGIRGPINNWLNMFLTHRKMKVVVAGEQSEEVTDSRVPQNWLLQPTDTDRYSGNLKLDPDAFRSIFCDGRIVSDQVQVRFHVICITRAQLPQ